MQALKTLFLDLASNGFRVTLALTFPSFLGEAFQVPSVLGDVLSFRWCSGNWGCSGFLMLREKAKTNRCRRRKASVSK